jgi:hypothetical protein
MQLNCDMDNLTPGHSGHSDPNVGNVTIKLKRGPSIKLFGNEMCKICDRKADGFHYNVLSCQGKLYFTSHYTVTLNEG